MLQIQRMRWPRKGILIRALIYGPLLGYFGWQAWQKWQADPVEATTPAEPTVDDKLERHKKTIELPDGTKHEIYELTPEQAEEILGHPVPPPPQDEDAHEGDPQEGEEAPPPNERVVAGDAPSDPEPSSPD